MDLKTATSIVYGVTPAALATREAARRRLLMRSARTFRMCGACAGSGEGMFAGAICTECRGEGEVPSHEEEPDRESER